MLSFLLYQVFDFALFTYLKNMEKFCFGNQHVMFIFPKSQSICYRINKDYIRPFHLLKIYVTKYFFSGNLFEFE